MVFSKVFTSWLKEQAQHNALSLASFQIGEVVFDVVARSIEKTNLELLREAEPIFGRLRAKGGSVMGVHDFPGALTLLQAGQREGRMCVVCAPLDGPRIGDELHFMGEGVRIYRLDLKGAAAHAWINDFDRKTLVERLRHLSELSEG